ncbi:hypothetical protein N1851_003882 [Merluccius polli]|uniref:Uncharacterized protein n=1 Tax=Merluccius polli TaxID=89951 RepID=A0AA47N7U0_MERPO|nr:hypothetical protein N1851_003882 [Merluccius polli]
MLPPAGLTVLLSLTREDEPKQVSLHTYHPISLFGSKKRSLLAAWYQRRDWLEYSFSSRTVHLGQGTRFDEAFTTKGFCDWKHAAKTNKGFHRHATSKEHLALCGEKEKASPKRLKKSPIQIN